MAIDYIIALKWISISAAGGNKDAVKIKSMMTKDMAPADIAKGETLAHAWLDRQKRRKWTGKLNVFFALLGAERN